MHRVAIYRSMRELIKHKSRTKMYLSDEHLHAMERCIHLGIKVLVEGLGGERLSQMCRCRGRQGWRGGDWQNNWVRSKQHLGRCYGALNGRLPLQLQQLFKIKLLNKDGAFVECWLDLVLTTIPENSGTLDPVSKFVQVRKVPAAIAFQVFSMWNIVSCAQIIPEIASSSMTGDWGNEWRIPNSLIDLAIWNHVDN